MREVQRAARRGQAQLATDRAGGAIRIYARRSLDRIGLVYWADSNASGPRRAAIAGGVTAVLAAPTVWLAVLNGYADDSFFTLTPWPRAGLAVLSAALILALFWVSAIKSAAFYRAGAKLGMPPLSVLAADLLASVALVTGAVGLSPQIYYSYYRLVLPGLPSQWVLSGWAALETLLRQARLLPDASLADHLVGLTFWSLLVMACWVFVFAHPRVVRRQVSARVAGGGAALVSGLIYGLT